MPWNKDGTRKTIAYKKSTVTKTNKSTFKMKSSPAKMYGKHKK